MPKEDAAQLEWFGADVEEHPERKRTEGYLGGYRGVDADVPRVKTNPDGTLTTELVRKPAPRHVTVKTDARDHDIGRVTARYKLMRSAFQFSPLDDKAMWEERMNIALAEMQVVRFRQKLARYESQPNPKLEQVQLYKNTISMWRGRFAELTHQG